MEAEQEIAQRLRIIREKLEMSQAEFATSVGVAQTLISYMEAGERPVSKKTLRKVQETLNVNPVWLKTGKGEMFLDRTTRLLNDMVTDQPNERGTILPAIQRHGEGTLSYGNKFLTILTIKEDMHGEELVIVVPEEAYASYHYGYRDPHYVKQLPAETVPFDLKGKGTIAKFQVRGDSMEPTIYDKDWVYASFVEVNGAEDLNKIIPSYIYIINTKDGLMCKRLYYERGDEYIACKSDNRQHEGFAVHIADIQQLWLVRRRYTGMLPSPMSVLRYNTLEQELVNLKGMVEQMNKKLG